MVDRYDGVFFTLGQTTPIAQGVARLMAELREQGEVGDRVALVNVADAFGIELANAARGIFEDEGFELVYTTSYPPTIQDVSPIINSAMAANPDIFVAFSYPPDTFALTEQAQVQGMQVDAFYTAVATNFPAYVNRFGDSINGNFGVGGVNPDDPRFVEYRERHMEVTGSAPDYWASAYTYASFQVLEQAIEGVGSLDRAAVTEYIKNNTFDTVMGEWDFENQYIHNYWTVGQWQNGKFYGIGSTQGMPGAATPIIGQ
jgi:branched-chain amino acid transport system substrate-binding protein